MSLTYSRRTPEQKVLSDDRLTICKVCRRGVYPSQEWCWSMKPMGIVHTGCTQEEKS